MTLSIKSALIGSAALFTLAACDTAIMAGAPAAGASLTFDQARGVYPDLSAVEFSVLDDNNNNLLDPSEAANINDNNPANQDALMVDDT